MSDRLVQLAANLDKVLGKRAQSIETALGEVTIVLNADTYLESAVLLRDDPSLANTDPLGAGWFFKMKLSDASQVDALLDETAYTAFAASH